MPEYFCHEPDVSPTEQTQVSYFLPPHSHGGGEPGDIEMLFILDGNHHYSSMDMSIATEPFILVTEPHSKRVEIRRCIRSFWGIWYKRNFSFAGAHTCQFLCIHCKNRHFGGTSLKDYIEERVLNIAVYIIENNATVRDAAKKFGISKSTVHKDVTERLSQINRSLACETRKVLDVNKKERHIRGGLATREKYLHLEHR